MPSRSLSTSPRPVPMRRTVNNGVQSTWSQRVLAAMRMPVSSRVLDRGCGADCLGDMVEEGLEAPCG